MPGLRRCVDEAREAERWDSAPGTAGGLRQCDVVEMMSSEAQAPMLFQTIMAEMTLA